MPRLACRGRRQDGGRTRRRFRRRQLQRLGTMKTRFSVAVIAILLSMSSAAIAQDRRDVQLADDIGRSIVSYARLTIFDDIGASVENGAVVLTGKVTMPDKKDDLEKRIARIDGVRSVRSDIGVLPVSPYDEQLRY